MRRKDKEILEKDLIKWIVEQAQVCRLGLSKDSQPYIVPVSFGFDGEQIYFHTAVEGTKIDYFTTNPQVCFEMEHDVKIIDNEFSPCKWTHSFYSVIGFGIVKEIAGLELKTIALNQIMRHYSKKDWSFEGQSLENVRLWSISIDHITGKKSRDKTAEFDQI